MGAANSRRYHRLPPYPASPLNQPLLQNEGQFKGLEEELRSSWGKLESEIRCLKSDISAMEFRIQSILQARSASGRVATKGNTNGAITYLEEKVENLKREFELEKRDEATTLTLQGCAIREAEEKIINLEMKVEVLEEANREMGKYIASNTEAKLSPFSTNESWAEISEYLEFYVVVFIMGVFIGLLL